MYVFGGAGRLVPFLEHAVWHASTLIIISITVERYYAIVKPLRKLSVCHKPHPMRVLPFVWAIAALAAVPFIIMTTLQDTKFYDGQYSMSAYTEIICPCTMRQAHCKKYSPDALMPPSGSYSPSLLLGTGIDTALVLNGSLEQGLREMRIF
jgi:hypothetical protein